MNYFDSLTHSMTTLATGGFSNYNESIGYFNSSYIEISAIIFILLGSLPFIAYIKFINGNKMFLSDSIYNHQPKVGDVILFPHYLMHTAYPFKSNAERRSFSFNLEIDSNIANVFSR